MKKNDLYLLNKKFDEVFDEMLDYNLINQDIEKYILLKKEMDDLKKKIEKETENTNFIFDPDNCLLLDKASRKILVNIYFKYIDKKDKSQKEFKQDNFINSNIFNQIKKYLINDKEKACEFLNSKEIANIKELSSINEHIKQLFCGICSINNIIEIKISQNINNNTIIYSVIISQKENEKENFYGKITFSLIYNVKNI